VAIAPEHIGIGIRRYFTQAGVHPYDTLEWERREARIPNFKDGTDAFYQPDVEFPVAWSQNSTNIVAQKYFRGTLGTDEREWSMRQVIDRVADTITAWGVRDGYFVDEQEGAAFRNELKYILVHQRAAFNSPVWFNIGVKGVPQQASACQPYDALVSTTEGPVPIGKIVDDRAIGTKVFDAHGITKVVAVKHNGRKNVLRIRMKAGMTLDVTPDHLVWKSTGMGSGRFVEAGTLRRGDQLEWHRPSDHSCEPIAVERVEIDRIEELGDMDVYDIQTESGEYLSGNLRVHNCFILAVDDTMDGILNWYREEGIIFKGGSGSGINLSGIRSSTELLDGGGTASGPVSFMRGADASAGTIKSGGKTRRGAKMVILNVDHPDVEDFIWCKALEERKARVLRDNGFDMDIGGIDAHSIQYQNANNSVRVTDDFMQAVEDDGDWELKGVLDGRTIKTMKARDLMRQLSEAAWECADPGMQFDTTINRWHTSKHTGRINASNPCFPGSELVHTDKGLIRFAELVDRAREGESFGIYTHDATNPDTPAERLEVTSPEAVMITGFNEIVKLTFSNGQELRCTPNHRIFTENRGYVRADELESTDKVKVLTLSTPATAADWAIPVSARLYALAGRGDKKSNAFRLPEKWSPEFAHYLGWLIGDGCISGDVVTTVYGSEEEQSEMLPKHQALAAWMNGGDVPKPSVQPNGTVQLRQSRRVVARFFEALGVSRRKAPEKSVPDSIYQAPTEIVAKFLQGLFDADGCVYDDPHSRYVGLGSASNELLRGVQQLLSTFGVFSRIYQTRKEAGPSGFEYTRKDGSHVKYTSKAAFDLRIAHRSIPRFAERIGFDIEEKRSKLAALIDQHRFNKTDETVRLRSRDDDGVELTFNLTEPRNHSYVVNGTIVANCSEYMHLDNSACNLASINLLKYLDDDGVFDTEAFEHTVEVVFTAQEILVGNADYPTPEIGDTSRKFRQLGMGYANLGALLMAQGLPYDSEEGRAWAAAITALMTGHAYATSAKTAGRMGPHAGYAENEEPMLDVLRMHRAEVAKIDEELVPPDLLGAAQRSWDEAVEVAEVQGVRNAQATVLAPTGTIGLMLDCDTTGIEPDLALTKAKKLFGGGTMFIVNQTIPRALRKLGYDEGEIVEIVDYIDENKTILGAPKIKEEHLPVFACSMGDNVIHYMGHVKMMGAVQPFISGAISKCVTGETLVTTADGLIRIGSLHRGEAAGSFRDEVLEVASLDGAQKTDAFYYGGHRPIREVVLRSGHRVRATTNHRLLVARDSGLDWVATEDLAPGDWVSVQYGDDLWSTLPARFDDFQPSPRRGSQKSVRIPDEMNEELAFLLGAYASEGHTTRTTWSVTITNSVDAVLERVAEAWRNQFGVEARIVRPESRCAYVVIASKEIVEFLEYLGCGARASEKRTPDAILRSPRDMVLEFLQGLALDAYVTTATAPKWAICMDSPALLDDLQAVLTNLGIVHGRVSKLNKDNGKTYDEVYVAGDYAQQLVGLVPFMEPDKSESAERLLNLEISTRRNTADIVPGIAPRELYELIAKGRSGRSGRGTGTSREFSFLCDPRTKHVTRRTLERVARAPGVVLPSWLQQVLVDNLHFSPVAQVHDAGVVEVFDLSVPTTHAFVGNGIVNHNTINCPEDTSVEEIERVHMEAWRLGLKAVAVYRDNCKVAQPLVTQKKEAAKDAAAAGAEDVAEALEHTADALSQQVERIVETVIVQQPIRQKPPRTRVSKTFSFRVADCHGYATVGEFEDGRPAEVFLKVAKQGSTLAGIMDAFAISVSHGLQYGVPLRAFVDMFTNMRFEPAGMTDDPDIRFATSLVDYIFRRLAVEYLTYDERKELGVLKIDERMEPTLPGVEEATTVTQPGFDLLPPEDRAPSDSVEPPPASPEHPAGSSAPIIDRKPGVPSTPSNRSIEVVLCYACGDIMQRAGSCFACPSCGATTGCS